MAWDPALLRKYNTTSHFRLLNQIRTELREQPIQRPLVTSRSAASGFGGGGRRGGRAASSASSGSPTSSAPPSSAQVTAEASSHSTTRRRSGASRPTSAQVNTAPRDHQPIVEVPVLVDVVLPDSHQAS